MFNIGLFSKFRTELMGIATILIILCHMPAHGVVMPSPLSLFLSHGGAGCDIFLFLSGLGMYRSLSLHKASGEGLLSWYKKRYLRLLFPYLLICTPVLAVYAVQNQWTIGQYFMRLSTLSFWSEGWDLWFVALMMVLYLITPLLIIRGNKKWIWTFILVLCTWIFGSLFAPEGVLKHIQFCVCRVPGYLLGFSLSPLIMEDKYVKIAPVLVVIVGMYIFSQAMGKVCGISVSTFWLEGVILLVLFTYVINGLKSESIVLKCFNFMGTISLESYCANVFFLPFFLYFPWKIGGMNLNPGNWTYYLVGTACCILASYFVNKLSKTIIKQITSYGS